MNFFLPIFSLMIEHDYFADGVWRDWSFVPMDSTQKILQSSNMLCRVSHNGLSVHIDERKINVLRLYAEVNGGSVDLYFKMFAQDRGYASYTESAQCREGKVWYFSNTKRLSSQSAWVEEQDCVSIDALFAQGMLNPSERRITPDAILHVAVKPEELEQHFTLRFKARQSLWKYYLLGEMANKQTAIVDLDNRFEFECCGDVTVAGYRTAKLFKSKQMIPVQEKSNYRFQLKDIAQRPNKVLVKRLGVASESRLGLELINGKSELVFENFVNF